jgi:phosphatidylserine/phosphatidylglycerophosphate/cardiolipin synthase-like enzyme
VIVIDDTWTLVQSGNYSVSSIPANERDGGDASAFVPGNRDTGLAVQSRPLARFLGDRLRADMQLARDGGTAPFSALALAEEIVVLAAAPTAPAPRLFPSKRFTARTPVRITPVLSPDNYMAIVPDLLASATRSVVIEQQYIRGHQPAVGRLLAALREAMDRVPALDVRIVLGHPFDDDGAQEIRALGERFGLELGRHVRLISPAHFVHCHNKLIVVDEESVLVGSQNWSDFAVTRNREVSLLLRLPELARYYAGICDVDWTTAVATLPDRRETVLFAPQAHPASNLVPLSVGDYALV